MSKNINNIHDKFFKSMMSDRQLATDFFLNFLPQNVIRHLDMSSMTQLQNSFISKELSEVFSDLIFQFNLKNASTKCCVSILVEHKSIKDEYTPFQILNYISQSYEAQIKAGQDLKLIIPFLFYHGKTKWELKSLSSFFSNYPDDLYRFIPVYDTVFADISTLSDDAILGIANLLLASALLSQKYSYQPKELEKRLLKIFQALSEQSERNFFFTLVVYLFQSVEIKENLIEIIKKSPANIKSEVMNTYDYLIKKGEEIGIRKGEEIGIEKSQTQVIFNAHKNGIAIEMIANITNLSVEKVKEVLKSQNKK